MRKWMLGSLLGSALIFGACQEQDRGPIENPGVGGAGPVEEESDLGRQDLPRPVDPADEGGLEEEGTGGGGLFEEEEGVLEEEEGVLGEEEGVEEREGLNPGRNINPGLGEPTEVR